MDVVRREIKRAQRRRNTRYKNPQLVAQLIVSLQVLRRFFAFFALRDQFVARQKHLLWVEESFCKKKSAGLL